MCLDNILAFNSLCFYGSTYFPTEIMSTQVVAWTDRRYMWFLFVVLKKQYVITCGNLEAFVWILRLTFLEETVCYWLFYAVSLSQICKQCLFVLYLQVQQTAQITIFSKYMLENYLMYSDQFCSVRICFINSVNTAFDHNVFAKNIQYDWKLTDDWRVLIGIALCFCEFEFDQMFLRNLSLLISYFEQSEYHRVMMFEHYLFTGQVLAGWVVKNEWIKCLGCCSCKSTHVILFWLEKSDKTGLKSSLWTTE